MSEQREGQEGAVGIWFLCLKITPQSKGMHIKQRAPYVRCTFIMEIIEMFARWRAVSDT